MKTIRSIMLIAAATLSLSACQTTGGIPSSPGAVADQTTGDEKVGLVIDTLYYAANRAAALAIRTGVVTDVAKIKRIGELDNSAKAWVQTGRDAYDAGNSAGYDAALKQVDGLTKSMLALLN